MSEDTRRRRRALGWSEAQRKSANKVMAKKICAFACREKQGDKRGGFPMSGESDVVFFSSGRLSFLLKAGENVHVRKSTGRKLTSVIS